jgi:glutamate-1-semialdehyde 2,1-aminomutase
MHLPYPFFVDSASGCKMRDVDGNEYIDFVNNCGPLILGHRHPKVVEAAKRQIDAFWLGAPSEIEVKLAERIRERYPCAEQVLFCPTGSEACMKAVRTFRALTGKKKIAMIEGAFHGSSDSLFVSDGIPSSLSSLIVPMRFGDTESVEAVVKGSRDDLAAVIVEPTVGSMGHVPANDDFYKTLREVTEREGVPLIFDEIVTGFRLAPGGAQERFHIKADMVVLGKVLGGGFPLAAFGAPEKVMDVWAPRESTSLDMTKPRLRHPGTYNDHKVAIAAGIATIDELTPSAYEKLDSRGDSIRRGLSDICRELKIATQVTGISSIFHVHFSAKPIVDAQSARTANQLLYRYFELGMLNKGINLGKVHCSFCSTPMGEEEIRQTLEAAREVLSGMIPMITELFPALLAN